MSPNRPLVHKSRKNQSRKFYEPHLSPLPEDVVGSGPKCRPDRNLSVLQPEFSSSGLAANNRTGIGGFAGGHPTRTGTASPAAISSPIAGVTAGARRGGISGCC